MHDSIRAPGRGDRTFLVHLLGSGLVDVRYPVTRFRSRADGDIVPVHPDGTAGKGKPRPSIMTLEKVRELCPGRDEIIIGIERRDCGMQARGIRASGIGCDRRLKGKAHSGDKGLIPAVSASPAA